MVTASTALFSQAVEALRVAAVLLQLGLRGELSLTFCAEVEPVTEHSFLPLRSSGPVMSVSSARTSRSWWASRYGPAKSTFCLRSSVIEYVATMNLTSPRWISVSRSALLASLNSMPLACSRAFGHVGGDVDVEAGERAVRLLQAEAGLVELDADGHLAALGALRGVLLLVASACGGDDGDRDHADAES